MRNRKLFLYVGLPFLIVGLGLATHLSTPATHQTVVAAAPVTVQKPDVYSLWQLTNQDRVSAGLQPLVLDTKLNAAAQDKCSDMAAKNYWSHDTPDGKHWIDFINAHETSIHAGENESYGGTNAQQVETGWMGSPEHKANILQPLFTNVGYAVCQGHNYTSPHLANTEGFIVTQEFTQE